jgi:hypothetical protein
VAPGPIVHRDEAVDATLHPLLRPLAFGDVVIDDSTFRVDPFRHPAGVSQGGDEEADAFLEGDVHPAPHPFAVLARGLLDEGVHADRPAGEPADEAEALPKLVAVHPGQRDRLNDAEPSGLGDRCYQLRVAAGVHRAADERHLDAGGFGERGGRLRGGGAHSSDERYV